MFAKSSPNKNALNFASFGDVRPTLQPFVLESQDPIPENPFQELRVLGMIEEGSWISGWIS